MVQVCVVHYYRRLWKRFQNNSNKTCWDRPEVLCLRECVACRWSEHFFASVDIPCFRFKDAKRAKEIQVQQSSR